MAQMSMSAMIAEMNLPLVATKRKAEEAVHLCDGRFFSMQTVFTILTTPYAKIRSQRKSKGEQK